MPTTSGARTSGFGSTSWSQKKGSGSAGASVKSHDDVAMGFDFDLVARQLRRARKRLKKSQPNVNKLSSAIESISYDDTIEGSSTLTVTIADPDFDHIKFFDVDKNGKIDRIDLQYPSDTAQWWRMTQLGANTDNGYLQLELTFMERPAVLLQKYHGPEKVSRGKKTRAEFFKQLVDKVSEKTGHPLRLYSYELHKKQPIYETGTSGTGDEKMVARLGAMDPPGIGGAMPPADPPTAQPEPPTASPPSNPGSSKKKDKDKKEKKERGIPRDFKGDIQGIPSTPAQNAQIERALNVAADLGASDRAIMAMLVAGIGESGFKVIMNLEGSGYGGVFQGDVSAKTFVWANNYDDTELMAKYFFKGGRGFQAGGAMAYAKAHQDASPGAIALAVEASNEQPSYYDAYADEARAIFEIWGGSVSGGPTYRRQQFNFEIGTTEDPYENYWDGMTRLASDVRWRLFINGKIIYFDDDMRLIKQKPVLTLQRDSARLISWNATWDARKIASEMSLDLIAKPFEFRAGDVFLLRGFGPLSRASSAKPDPLPGRWLVTDISRSSDSFSSMITLAQPKRPLKEPATERVEVEEEEKGVAGTSADDIEDDWTPKDVIDNLILPLARKHNMVTGRNPGMVVTQNAAHSPNSWHKGPPESFWAADMSNGVRTAEQAALADNIARKMGFTEHANHVYQFGTDDIQVRGFKMQLGYLVADHYDHVHFGCAKA